MPEQDLLARAGRMVETATTLRESDPHSVISLAASVVVMAHVAVLHAHGQQPIPTGERHLGTDVAAMLGEPLILEDRLAALLDTRDGLGAVDADEALTDARNALERANAAIQSQPGS